MKLNILSWNIWCDCYFDKIKEFLAAADADIIGLQEVALDDPERDVVNFLKDMGYEHVTTGACIEFADDNNKLHKLHNAIFSKFPIVGNTLRNLREGGKRAFIEAEIEIEGKKFSVSSIHLKHTHQKETDNQNAQVETLVRVLPSEHTIIIGDFNATPTSRPIQIMKTKYVSVDDMIKPTWSMYPEGCPECKPQKLDTRLDYIFVSPDVKFESFKIGESKGSDHLPVSVTIEV